jgi:hypothetical protein
MIWIVRFALQRPYTFIVLALLILIVAPFERVNASTRLALRSSRWGGTWTSLIDA